MAVNDILSNVAVAEGTIPYGMISFTEAASYVAESIDEDFNELVNETDMFDEFGSLYGSVNEGVVDTVVDFFQRAWAKIKEYFAKAKKWFEDRIDQIKEEYRKLTDAIANKIDDARYKKAVKFIDKISTEVIAAARTAKDAEKTKFTYHDWNFTAENESRLFKNVMAKINASNSDSYDDIPGAIHSMTGLNDVKTVSDLRRSTYKALGKEAAESTDLKNISDGLITTAKTYVIDNGNVRSLKEAYNEFRRMIKDRITELKRMSKDDIDKEDKKNQIKSAKLGLQIAQTMYGAELDCRKQAVEESRKILKAVLTVGSKEVAKKKNKKEEEKPKAESAFIW